MADKSQCDFSGWATRANILCADGRTILPGAFSENNGKTVPVVWMHQHDDPENVLGHALLEDRNGDMYAYVFLNDSDRAKAAREGVRHGDINQLSIYANKLKHRGKSVVHGLIREVSLVLAGANPGAFIDCPVIAHSDMGEEIYSEDEAVIYNDMIGLSMAHAEETQTTESPSVSEVYNGMTDDQKVVTAYLMNSMAEQVKGENDSMSHNVFERDAESQRNYLSHDDMKLIFDDARRCGSLRDAVMSHLENGVLAHAVTDENGKTVTYGVADINYLFPDARTLDNEPDFIKRQDEWVAKVMGGVHHTPFTRIKSIYADITMDEARAKGYMKGKLKKEEVFSLLKRTTSPQTVYKKQKLDRDDILDITDFDVVAWIKREMRMMLNEEIARAILVGDGRLPSDDDHISEEHIHPIWKEEALYTVHRTVTEGADLQETAKNMMREAVRARKDYRGSGNPTLFTTEEMLTEILLMEDGINHRLYKSKAEVATAMRVDDIVTVPVMENLVDKNGKKLFGIIVNMKDYNVGADKGGEINLFDDFDIDYNQYKYLIETRISGALIKPYSAIILESAGNGTTDDDQNP